MDQESTLIQQLRRNLGRMEAAMDAIHDALAISDEAGHVLWCNASFLRLCKQALPACLGQSLTALLPPAVNGEPLLPGGGEEALSERSGSRVVELRQSPLQVVEIQWDPIPEEQPAALLFCCRDISTLISYQKLWEKSESIQQRSREIEHLNARLRLSQKHLASKVFECPVTGLPNRRSLIEHLDQALGAGRRQERFAVLFCDLNRFKQVNDGHGHNAGDALLIEISRRLRGAIRQGDLVARLGGDEFVVVSHNLLHTSQAQDIADRLQQAVGQPWTIGRDVLHPSFSIGIAIANDGSEAAALTAQDLIQRADQAMYAAKSAHTLSAQLYDASLAQRQEQTTRTLQALRLAIARRSLALHLQPIVALSGGALHGYEALVRLPGADGVLLGPDRFIAHAERSRLIAALGQQVLEQALACLPRSGDSNTLNIAVNVSPLELNEPGFAARVLKACSGAGLEPGRLQLEITETAVIAQPRRAAEVLSQLRQAGVRIHLDDFGTGYSSLSLLSELPVDGIKIDRSYTASLGRDRTRTAMIQALTLLCRELGLSVIAEGIETEAQRQRLIALGCPYGQGYLFGRPGPLDGGCSDPR